MRGPLPAKSNADIACVAAPWPRIRRALNAVPRGFATGCWSPGKPADKLRQCTKALLAIGMLAASLGVSDGMQVGYRLGKLDVIRIEVPGEEALTLDSTVSENGSIRYAMLGELKVEGLTVSEVADLLRRLLVEKNVLAHPGVSVTVREFRSQYVTVLGEVGRTGKYFLKGSERLVDIIAEAGGLSPNGGDISVSRKSSSGFQEITVQRADLPRDGTILGHGDVVFVKTRPVLQVYVSGEVTAVRPVAWFDGMTVSQAVLSAGGLTRFGSKSKVTIKRVLAGKESVIRVNLSRIESGKTADFPVQPNDLIIVGRRIF